MGTTFHFLLVLLVLQYGTHVATGQGCMRTQNVGCKKSCTSGGDCRGGNKQCLCDGSCGRSCVNPALVCERLEDLAHGRIAYNPLNRRFNSDAFFFCDNGYHLEGENQRRCNGHAQWTGESPVCVETRNQRTTELPAVISRTTTAINPDAACGPPRNVENAHHDGGDRQLYSHGTIVTYSCNFGFYRDGLSRARCLAESNEWYGPTLECNPKSCGDPGELLHGSREGELFTFGNDILLQCDVGYELRGTGWRVCQADGTWSGSQPTCQPVRCPALGPLDHGDTFGTEVTYGSTVRHTCNTGYKIAGLTSFARSVVTRCEANGQWNKTAVRCTGVDCGSPGTLDNGAISYLGRQNTAYGSVVTFRCDANTELEGEQNSVCEENEQWSKPLPTCWGRCSRPDVPNGDLFYSDRETDWFDHRASLRFYCRSRHDKNREDENPQCFNGTWSFDPECIPNPCRQSKNKEGSQYTYPNGTTVPAGTMVKHDVTLTLSCDPGYRLKDRHQEFRCDRGSWIPPLSECEGEPCEVPRIPGKDVIYKVITRRTYTRLNTDDEVDHSHGMQVTCDSNYEREGNGYSWCNLGNWDQVPRCNPRPCQIASAFGSIYEKNSRPRDRLQGGDSVEHGQEVRVRCEDRYEIENDLQTRECSFGKWLPGNTRDLPKCTGRACPMPSLNHVSCVHPGQDHSNRDSWLDEDFKIPNEQSISCQCHDGYALSNGDTEYDVSCRFGQHGTDQECQPEPCALEHTDGTIYRSPDNHVIDDDSVAHGERVTVECERGYRLQSQSREVNCTFGQWSQPLETCAPVKCDAPELELNGGQILPTKGEYDYGEAINIHCPDGHTLQGAEDARCSTRGWRWSSNEQQPMCIPAPCSVIRTDRRFSRIQYSEDAESNKLPDGTTANVTCARDYVASVSHVVCRTGDWIPEEPICEWPGCTIPQLPAFITIGRSKLRPGTTVPHRRLVVARCRTGYVHAQPGNRIYKVAKCARGSWNVSTECVSKPCYFNKTSEILNIAGAERQGPSWTYKVEGGQTVTFTCQPDGPGSRAVCEGGVFKPASPCEREQPQGCEPPEIDSGYAKEMHGERNITAEVVNGSRARVLCPPGMSLSNPNDNVIMCLQGSWNISTLDCNPDPCEIPELRRGQYFAGEVAGQGRSNGSTIFYRCGNQNFIHKCFRGRWNPPVDDCSKDWCQFPVDLPDAQVKPAASGRLYRSGTQITVFCGSDKLPIKREYTCDKEEWKPREPSCRPYCVNGQPSFFSRHQGCWITQYNNKIIDNKSPDECKDECLKSTDFLCMSFDYDLEPKRKCFLSTRNSTTAGRKYDCSWRKRGITDYYERTCYVGSEQADGSRRTPEQPTVSTTLRTTPRALDCSIPEDLRQTYELTYHDEVVRDNQLISEGEEVRAECLANHRISDLVCVDGGLQGEPPPCGVNEDIRCQRPIVHYSQFQPPNTHEFSVGDILRITCEGGHLMTSQKSAAIECLETGRWSESGHACVKYEITYRVYGTSYYESILGHQHLFVYKPERVPISVELYCRPTPQLMDLEWNSQNGDSEELNPRSLRGGLSKLTIENPHAGSSQLTCLSPSQNTGTSIDITISDTTCEDPGEAPLARRYPPYEPRRLQHRMGDNIRYWCDSPRTLVGENLLKCQSDGRWSHVKPRCQLQE